MSGTVTFDYAAWVAIYPEFSGVSQPAAQNYFNLATIYQKNRLGPIPTVEMLTALLYQVTAHITALNSSVTSAGANPLTPPGRLASATEGSVSAQFENNYPLGTAQWFQQTKYGSAYWAATVAFRTMRYYPGRTFAPGLAQTPWLYPNGS